MKTVLPPIVLCLAIAGPVFADGAAAVRVVPAQQGAAPAVVTGYGQAAPASQSLRSLSVLQPGQVTAVMVTAGQAVKRGQPLLTFAAAPSIVANYRQAQTALSLARSQAAHLQALRSQQLATRDQSAAADKALVDAETLIAALAREGANRSTTVLRAPADGLTATVPATLGDRPAPGATLVTFAPSSALQVSVGVEAGWRALVKVGQAATLDPVGGGPSIQGRVIRVDAVLNPKTRLVDVDIASPSATILSGEAFRATIVVGHKTGWLVPHEAVEVEGGKAFVFQVAGGKAVRVDVGVVQVGGRTDVVSGSLNPHRPLVAIGAYQLEDGAAVRVMR